jgi:DNA-directed RNA polymerase specialized sigma24 family protein
VDAERALAIFGDVVRSRRDAPATAIWLRQLARELDETYGPERFAPFGFTQGDELQGLLRPSADPFEAILRAALREDNRPMRWVVVLGEVEPGSGPATERTGPVFLEARDLLAEAKRRRDRLLVRTGSTRIDALLDDLAPLLAELLDDLSTRQRVIGRLLLVDDLRQADAAARLDVSRATISVVAERGRIRPIGRLRRALLRLLREAAA